jgi:LysR family transcriptional regulator for metE and metH
VRAGGFDREVVRLGVAAYGCYHWLPGFHSHAREHLPDVALELAVVGPSPVTHLNEGHVDIVLAVGEPGSGSESAPLFTDELVLIASPGHRATAHRWIEPEFLADEVYFTYNRTPSPGFEYERFLRPADVAPRTTIVIEDTGAIAEMVASGAGVSILSRWALTPWLEAGSVVAIPCGRRGLALEWRFALRSNTAPDSATARVAAALASWLVETSSPDPTAVRRGRPSAPVGA